MRRPLSCRIRWKLLAFVGSGCALLGTFSAACSAPESGLVLGRPLPQVTGGGGSEPGSGGAGEAGEGSFGLAGEGGSAGLVDDPIWIQQRCTPTLTFENSDTTSKGQLFTDAVPDPQTLVWAAAHDACRALYRFPDDVKQVDGISLVVGDYDGIAGVGGTVMHLSTSYLQDQYDQGVDLRQEIAGILHFTTSLVYQNPGPDWLYVGIADFVRLDANLLERRQRTKGGSYFQSSQATAFFLDYLAGRNPEIVYQLNRRLGPEQGAWSDDAFVTYMGYDLDTLWSQYQATLPD